MSISYVLPTEFPETDIAQKNLRTTLQSLGVHQDALCEVAIARHVRDFLAANPEVVQLQIELGPMENDDGCLWEERFMDMGPEKELNDPATKDDLSSHTRLYKAFSQLHENLQASLDLESAPVLRERYGEADPMSGDENQVWFNHADAVTLVEKVETQLRQISAPVIKPEPLKRARRRPGT
jgi:hypothetical protein